MFAFPMLMHDVEVHVWLVFMAHLIHSLPNLGSSLPLLQRDVLVKLVIASIIGLSVSTQTECVQGRLKYVW